MTLLNVQDLTVTLNQRESRTLVNKVNFTIAPGETLALVGESGSGKSLTALAMMQLLAKNFGITASIYFDGKELNGASENTMQAIRGRDVSMIFQEPMTALNPLHAIGKQIAEAITIHSKHHKESEQTASVTQKVATLLDHVGLSHFKNRLNAYPHQLSGGERQRVMIAMAIANHPKLLIADEPTTAVDVHVQQHILELLATLKRNLKMSMLFITHDLPLVKRMADKIAVMKAGEIVEIGTVSSVFNNPQHPYTQKLLGSAPKGQPLPVSNDAPLILHAENLSVKFPIKQGIFARTVGYNIAVDTINMQIRRGETLGVVGESGSGKTTLAFAILRMVKSLGTVVFIGQELSTQSQTQLRGLRKNMQMVFQDPFSSLNPRMTVGEIIAEGLHVHEPPNANFCTRVQEILEKVGLSADMASRYPHEFSGGQRQRISIARAMVLQPKLVVLDEPTSALDLTVQSQILDLLKTFQREQGISYVFISHDLRVIRAIAHRILVLKSGKIVESGPAEIVLQQPKAEYTKKLIEAAML